MRAPGLALAAASVLAVEGAALAVIAMLEFGGLGAGDAASVPTGVALIALTLLVAFALFAFAVGTRSRRSWARSGGVVLQVLAIALALTSLTLQPIPWMFVLGVGLPSILGLALLVASARREGRDDSADRVRPAED